MLHAMGDVASVSTRCAPHESGAKRPRDAVVGADDWVATAPAQAIDIERRVTCAATGRPLASELTNREVDRRRHVGWWLEVERETPH